MGNPETNVEIPDWLEGALKPLLTGAAERYGQFAQTGDQRYGERFWQNNARGIAGLTGQERQAMAMANRMGEMGRGDLMAARNMLQEARHRGPWLRASGDLLTGRGDDSQLRESRRLQRDAGEVAKEQVTGKNLGADRAIAQARDQFTKSMLPTIQNQATLQGLGRSTSLNAATGAAQAQYMLPLIQGGLQREERGIDRRYGDLMGRSSKMFGEDMARAGAMERRGRGDQANLQNLAAARMGLGSQLFGRGQQQIGTLSQLGANARSVQQARKDAQYNDLMRRFGAYEQSLAGPLGMVGSVFGSSSSKF